MKPLWRIDFLNTSFWELARKSWSTNLHMWMKDNQNGSYRSASRRISSRFCLLSSRRRSKSISSMIVPWRITSSKTDSMSGTKMGKKDGKTFIWVAWEGRNTWSAVKQSLSFLISGYQNITKLVRKLRIHKINRFWLYLIDIDISLTSDFYCKAATGTQCISQCG